MPPARAIALLVSIAFLGAIFTPCQATTLTSAFLEAASEEMHWDATSEPVSQPHAAVTRENSRAEHVVLKARCPCGCDERPALAGSSPGLGIALVSHAPSLVPLPGDQELEVTISFLPTSPLSGIDTVPRSA